MVKYLFFFIFLIPLSFYCNFWLVYFIYLLGFFMFIFLFSYGSFFMNIGYFFFCDYISYFMILLSIWICSLMVLASEKVYKESYFGDLFLLVIGFLMISLLLTFASLNVFIFYLFFEVSLIFTLMLILGWGYQPERIQAGMYMFFYTLLASLPMMVGIFYIYLNSDSASFDFINNYNSFFLYICMISVFLVKVPMFMVHLWLPKAHVEAPVSGSMILAGIMLKLGGYGLMRFMKYFILSGLKYNFVFVVISLIGGFIISLICLRQSDVKSLIAYSSVSHMGLVLGGLMAMNCWGFYGSLIMMVAHGLCSSGLFCLANIAYERLASRNLFLIKGLINLMPSMAFWWFLFCSSNMAAPPSFNLVGEIMLINSLSSMSYLNIFLLGLMSFFGAAYSLYLYSYSQHGNLYLGVFSFSSGCIREYLLLFLHWTPLNFLFFISDCFIF
uniref:NADH-ubiquinone oxidoreductase chain 4 n=1 Tax=Teslasena femoralis TaxID=1622175 RepID=A0A0H3UL17_9COLE|nr:NADH dehydrogenase subunit 4 [Teslasena femoralis]